MLVQKIAELARAPALCQPLRDAMAARARAIRTKQLSGRLTGAVILALRLLRLDILSVKHRNKAATHHRQMSQRGQGFLL